MTSRQKAWALALILCLGIWLRFIWASDMEYKEDEIYMFDSLMKAGAGESWPWLGIASGVYIRNPGLSVWIFVWLGKLVNAQDPVALCRAAMGLNVLALFLLIPFIKKFIASEDREPWYWALALAAVNPFAVMYQRKIWAQSVLPIFCLMFLAAWMSRRTRWGSFFWGLTGAFLGQIHMSGFAYALAFFIWALLWDRKKIFWGQWIVGSCLASITLVPWLIHVFTEPIDQTITFGWGESIQLRYWVFWLTDPVGLHLGKSVGGLYGNSWYQQLSEFFKFPLLNGSPTYLVAGIHFVLAALMVYAYGLPLLRGMKRFSDFSLDSRGVGNRLKTGLLDWISIENPTQFAILAALIPYGILLTVPGFLIYRFYLNVTFPLFFVWFARFLLKHHSKNSYRLLSAFVIVQLLMSAAFISFIHENGGAEMGDYGKSFRLMEEGGKRP